MVTLFDDVSFLHGVSGYIGGLDYDRPSKTIRLRFEESDIVLFCRTGWADPVLVSDLYAFLCKAERDHTLITTGVKYGFSGREWFCAAKENNFVTARRQFIQAEDEPAYRYDDLYHEPNDMASGAPNMTNEEYDDMCVAECERLELEAKHKRLDKKIKKLEVELAQARLNCPEGYAIVPKVNGKSPYLAEFDSSSYEYDETAKDPLLALRQQRYQDEFVS